MPQLFPRAANTLVRVALAVVALTVAGVALGGYRLYFAPYTTQVGQPIHQVVPFSHEHHVSGLGIDCRYCHTSVETAAFAGIPPTETCMTCHSQVWNDAPILAPVRESWATNRPLHWQRVNDLPDHVYFNHSIHIAKNIACVSCHGPIGAMPLTWKNETLYMRWCLECHRDPEPRQRPREQLFQTTGLPPQELGIAAFPFANPHGKGTGTNRFSDCSTCHR